MINASWQRFLVANWLTQRRKILIICASISCKNQMESTHHYKTFQSKTYYIWRWKINCMTTYGEEITHFSCHKHSLVQEMLPWQNRFNRSIWNQLFQTQHLIQDPQITLDVVNSSASFPFSPHLCPRQHNWINWSKLFPQIVSILTKLIWA